MADAKKERRARIKSRLEDRGEYKFESQEAEQEATSIVIQAERDLAECHVNFRWQREQLDLVKRAADEIGVPYQTYIKLCVFRQAKQDLGISSCEAANKAEFDLLRSEVHANEMKLAAIIQQSSILAAVHPLSLTSLSSPVMGMMAMMHHAPSALPFQSRHHIAFLPNPPRNVPPSVFKVEEEDNLPHR